MSTERRGAPAEVDPAGVMGGVERVVELVLAGLTMDEDELLGDLAEGRAQVAEARGARAARRWWWGQALRAAPRLVWHALVHRPWTVLLGLAGFALWATLASLAYTASWFPVGEQDIDVFHPQFPSVSQVIRDTALVGAWNLLAAVIVGAGVTAVVRRARLVPAVLAAAPMALISTRHAFYIVYGPGTCTMSTDQPSWVESCSIELGAWSSDVIVPVLWQLPTMMVLLPLATTLGGLAVLAWTRRHPWGIDVITRQP
jgi:hypothetical protein